MADNSLIEWTDTTWNPITGCSVVSPGCTNCYAMKLAGTRLKHLPSRAGLTVAGVVLAAAGESRPSTPSTSAKAAGFTAQTKGDAHD